MLKKKKKIGLFGKANKNYKEILFEEIFFFKRDDFALKRRKVRNNFPIFLIFVFSSVDADSLLYWKLRC